MTTIRQRITLTTLIGLASCFLLLSFFLHGSALSAPMQARGSISSRVQTQTELCESVGGGKTSVSYSYENGKMVSAQTTCKGGTENGLVCVNDAKTTDCYKVKQMPNPRPGMDVEHLPQITAVDSDEVTVSPDGGLIVGAGEPVSTLPAQSTTTMVDLETADPVAGGQSGEPVVHLTPVSNPNTGMLQDQVASPTPTSAP
jgi:hypothetical protein